MMSDRGLSVDLATAHRRVLKLLPVKAAREEGRAVALRVCSLSG
jgi:hypothetical protein